MTIAGPSRWIRRARMLLPLSLVVYLAAQPLCAQSLELTAVRFWSLGDVTRIALEANGEFVFKTDRLSNPNRVFFDLKDTRPKMISKGVYTVAVHDDRVRQVRVAETTPGTTRIVIDLTDGDFEVNTSQ